MASKAIDKAARDWLATEGGTQSGNRGRLEQGTEVVTRNNAVESVYHDAHPGNEIYTQEGAPNVGRGHWRSRETVHEANAHDISDEQAGTEAAGGTYQKPKPPPAPSVYSQGKAMPDEMGQLEEQLHPHRKACRDASRYFMSLSKEKAFGFRHQDEAGYHMKQLEPIFNAAHEVNITEGDSSVGHEDEEDEKKEEDEEEDEQDKLSEQYGGMEVGALGEKANIKKPRPGTTREKLPSHIRSAAQDDHLPHYQEHPGLTQGATNEAAMEQYQLDMEEMQAGNRREDRSKAIGKRVKSLDGLQKEQERQQKEALALLEKLNKIGF